MPILYGAARPTSVIRKWRSWALLVPAILLLTGACGSDTTSTSVEPTQPATPQAELTPGPQTVVPTQPPASRSDATPGLQTFVASSDLSVGTNRVFFGLVDRESGPIRGADVEVSTFYLTGAGAQEPKETVKAVFRQWPIGPGGVYTAQLSFDRAGAWGIEAVVVQEDEAPRTSTTRITRIQVKEKSDAPAIGSFAPRSENKTSRDVGSLEDMTTDTEPDPDLYRMTIAEAIDTGKPLVVVFATPAYCETATCGPQVDVIKHIKRQHVDQVNFIHVEVYDNPQEIQGDLRRGQLSPTLTEWNLTSEPWTFIVNGEGLVQAKFEGFTTGEELEEALAGVLQ